MPTDFLSLAIVALAILTGSTMRGYAGFGLPLVAGSIMIFILEPVIVVPLVLMMQVMAGLTSFRVDWPQIDRMRVGGIMTGAVFGIPVGVALLLVLDLNIFRLTTGLLVVTGTLFMSRGFRSGPLPFAVHAAVGVLAGAMHGLAGLSGPSIVVTFLAQSLEPKTMKTSNSVLFTLLGLVALAILIISGSIHGTIWIAAAALYPVTLLGLKIGEAIFTATGGRGYRQIALTLLFLLGLSLAVRGALGVMAG